MAINGGQIALSGYLYQLVGTCGVAAQIVKLSNEKPIEDSNNILLKVFNIDHSAQLQVLAEEHEDAFFRTRYGIGPSDTAALIQFKFSNKPLENPIRRQDLKDILENFERSVEDAVVEGENITALVLITNRKLTKRGKKSSQLLWNAVENSGIPKYYLNLSIDHFFNELQSFATPFGVLDNEIEGGIRELIAMVFIEAADKEKKFTDPADFKEKLLTAFTNYPRTSSLEIKNLELKNTRFLDEFKMGLIVEDGRIPIYRSVQDSILEKMLSRALICVHGDGGCGKSVLLWQIGKLLSSSAASIIRASNDVFSNFIPIVVNEWLREIPVGKHPNDQLDQAIERICVANKMENRPVFILGLDGLDEIEDQTQQRPLIQGILRWFWKKDQEARQMNNTPSAVLLVSCREERTLWDFLGIPGDHPNKDSFPISEVVQPFNNDEMVRALQKFFPGQIPDVVEHNPLEPFTSLLDASWRDENGNILGQIVKDNDLASSLSHPVVWRSLLNLDVDVRLDVLNAEPDACDSLAEQLMNWFVDKIRRREKYLPVNRDEIKFTLQKIANNSEIYTFNSVNLWLENSKDVFGIAAGRFFSEAVSSGLIDKPKANKWRWKHKFLYDYLVRE